MVTEFAHAATVELLDVEFATVELEVAIARTYNQLALQYALLDIYVAINDEERRNLEIANKRRHAGLGTDVEIECTAFLNPVA